MIQRIQTVFLFVAFVLVGLLFYVPFATLISDQVYSVLLTGITTVQSVHQPYWLTALGGISALLILIIIFLFKNRKLQMKLTLFAILLLLLLNGAMFLVSDKYKNLLSAEINFSAVFVLPLIAAIFLFLAYRGIKRDEQLIKSLDRLR